jgi:hypothetical protein
MSMSYKHDLENCSHIDKLFEITRADLNKTREHEEVSIYHQLNEELCLLPLDVEVV